MLQVCAASLDLAKVEGHQHVLIALQHQQASHTVALTHNSDALIPQLLEDQISMYLLRISNIAILLNVT